MEKPKNKAETEKVQGSGLFAPDAPGALVAVFGEQAAGKTVFLACVFRTIDLVVKQDDLVVTFDRKLGGASYFREVEEEVARSGKVAGSAATTFVPCRLILQHRDALPLPLGNKLPIDLRDFAGRHFRAYADQRAALEEGVENKAREVYQEVDKIAETADAVIILISSLDLDPARGNGGIDPFTPSVMSLIGHCRGHRVPIALLVSQADRVPALSDNEINLMPRIVDFRRKFTSDRAESNRGGRPFGIVRAISCYTTDAKGLPVRVTTDGRFWREEPAEVVLTLLRVALPEIRRRLQRLVDDEHRKHEANVQKERDKGRRVAEKLGRAILVSFIALALVAAGVVGFVQYRDQAAVQGRASVLRLAASEIAAGRVEVLDRAALGRLEVAVGTAGDARSSDTMAQALGDLERAILLAARRTLDGPALSPEYRRTIQILLNINGSPFEPKDSAWEASLAPALKSRIEFLSSWLGNPPSDASSKLSLLQRARQEALRVGDAPFAERLQREAVEVRLQKIDQWDHEILASEVSARISLLRSLIPEALREADHELRSVSLSFLGSKTVWALMDRAENGRLQESLVSLRPSLKPLQGNQLRFDIVSAAVASCDSESSCRSTIGTLADLERQLRSDVDSRRPLVESALRELLQPLEPNARLQVWGSIVHELERSYLFSYAPDSWPTGLRPLGARLSDALGMPPTEIAASMEQCLVRLVSTPIYESEVSYIGDLAKLELARVQLAREYDRLVRLDLPRAFLDTAGLSTIGAALGDPQAQTGFIWDTWPQPTSTVRAEVSRPSLRSGPRGALPGSLAQWFKDRRSHHCADIKGAT